MLQFFQLLGHISQYFGHVFKTLHTKSLCGLSFLSLGHKHHQNLMYYTSQFAHVYIIFSTLFKPSTATKMNKTEIYNISTVTISENVLNVKKSNTIKPFHIAEHLHKC